VFINFALEGLAQRERVREQPKESEREKIEGEQLSESASFSVSMCWLEKTRPKWSKTTKRKWNKRKLQ